MGKEMYLILICAILLVLLLVFKKKIIYGGSKFSDNKFDEFYNPQVFDDTEYFEFSEKPKKERKRFTIFGENVGRTIKFLAKVLFWLGAVASIIGCLICVVLGASENEYEWIWALIGIAVLIIGVVVSWFNTLLLYGFGSLIEDCKRTAENTERDE